MTTKAKLNNYTNLTYEHLEKVLSRCTQNMDECLIWEGAKTNHGYGNISIHLNGKTRWLVTHRLVFAAQVSTENFSDLEIDHLCRNRLCCNIDHLEAVTTKVNTHRGISFSAVNKLKTHYKWGHEFNETNTWVSPNGKRRRCRICDKNRRERRLRGVSCGQYPRT